MTSTLNETAALERHNGATPALPVVTGGSLPGLAVLEQWVTAASQAARLVEPLIASAFVPEAYKPRIPASADQDERNAAYRTALGNATSAVLLGMSLGVDPLTALQNIYIVHGRPGMYSKFKAALAMAAGHDVWVEERSNESVTVAGRRKGWAADKVVRVTITKEDAERAGWTSNPLYGKTPADMYQWRAMGRVVDQIAPDTLSGIASVEDLDDIPPDRSQGPVTVTRTAAPPGQASEALRAALEQEPARNAEAVAEDAQHPDPAQWPIDEAQWRKVNSRFVDLGVVGSGQKEDRLKVVSRIVDRVVDRGSDLTAAEGALILDNLAGTVGARLVDEILGRAPLVEEERRVGDQDSDPSIDAGDDDTQDSPEPAADEGRPAALEGVADPWGPSS